MRFINTCFLYISLVFKLEVELQKHLNTNQECLVASTTTYQNIKQSGHNNSAVTAEKRISHKST